LKTIPDLKGFAAANGQDGKTDDEIRAAMGDKFPKHIYHSIICIGGLIAHRDNEHWIVDSLGAPHIGQRSERDLIAAFVNRIAELSPQLITFNGSEFDLPVLRYPSDDAHVVCRWFVMSPLFSSIHGGCHRPL
jgi:predicted PolB exonuclease-like 3'-5' exonuclease